MPTIKTCLWIDGKVDEMITFYQGVFPSLEVTEQSRYPDSDDGTPGATLVANIQIFGTDFMLLNGGPHYVLNPSVSIVVNCDGQHEVDYYWDHLLEGGEPSQCGWLTDRFGLSWQIVPVQLGQLMSDPDPEKSGRVMQAMLQMVKLDVPTLEAAHRGESGISQVASNK